MQLGKLCLWLFICLPVLAQVEPNSILLTNIGVWDSASGEVHTGQHILIVADGIVHVGRDKPPAPAGVQLIDGAGHVAVGAVAAGRIANFLVLDKNPQEDISILAQAHLHTRLLVKDGRVIENYYATARPSSPQIEDPDHVWLRTIKADNGWASIGFGGIFAIDGLDFVQDDDSKQQVGDLSEFKGADISAARFVLSGHLGRRNPVHYYMDWGYNGFDEGFDIRNNDEYSLYNLEFRLPETRLGEITIGRMKAPTTISRAWSGTYLPLSARQAPVTALTKSRDDGIRLTNTAFEKRVTYGVGLFNDWLTEGQDIGDTNTYVTGRVTGLLLDNQTSEHLLQIGLGTRWTEFAEESIRFRAKPGIPFVPDYLDTGEMPGDEVRWLTGEIAWRKQDFMLTAEHIRTELDSPSIDDPTFVGSYVWFEHTLTGETRSYDRDKAIFGRPRPLRDFSKGGIGLWSIGVGLNDTDLNQGPIDGGDMQQIIVALNWYPQRSFRWGLEYGRTWLDRDGLASTSDFLHLFFHISNL